MHTWRRGGPQGRHPEPRGPWLLHDAGSDGDAGGDARSDGAGVVPVGDVAYSRLQLWSIAEHFEQRPAVLPLMADPYAGRPLQPRFL